MAANLIHTACSMAHASVPSAHQRGLVIVIIVVVLLVLVLVAVAAACAVALAAARRFQRLQLRPQRLRQVRRVHDDGTSPVQVDADGSGSMSRPMGLKERWPVQKAQLRFDCAAFGSVEVYQRDSMQSAAPGAAMLVKQARAACVP